MSNVWGTPQVAGLVLRRPVNPATWKPILHAFGHDDRIQRVGMPCASAAKNSASKNNTVLHGLEYMCLYDLGLCSCLVHMFLVG